MRSFLGQKQKVITFFYILIGLWLLVGVIMTAFQVNSIKEQANVSVIEQVLNGHRAKDIVSENIQAVDENAMTDQGVVQSFEIDKDSAVLSDDGQLTYRVQINNDGDMYVVQAVQVDETGHVRSSGDLLISSSIIGRLINQQKESRDPAVSTFPNTEVQSSSESGDLNHSK